MEVKKDLQTEVHRQPQPFPFMPRMGQIISFDYPNKSKEPNRQKGIYERSNMNPVLLIGGFENERFAHGTNLRYFQLYPDLHAALHQLIKNVLEVNSYDRSTGELIDNRMAATKKLFSPNTLSLYSIDFKPPGQPKGIENIMEYYWRRYDMYVMKNLKLININNAVATVKNGGIFK
jgi:hypothetical protein